MNGQSPAMTRPPNPPAGDGRSSNAGSRPHVVKHLRIYALSVRPFMQAAELVDADEDIINDILGFDGVDVEPADAPDGDDGDPLIEYREGDAQPGGYPEDDLPFLKEGELAWTEAEIHSMMSDLKEKGRHYFVTEYVGRRGIPIPKLLYAFGICLCKELQEKSTRTLAYFLDVAIHRVLENREKLPMYNTVDDAVRLIRDSKRILILTGAGISVSCGIPDFRSRNGLYATLQSKGEYNLDDPQEMFDINYFKRNPSVFYSFASQIYPSNFIPSPCHRFIKLIEDKGKLLRNYTQNIDTLETRAGVKRVINCHGSFATASCINCKKQFRGDAIEEDIMNRRVPICQFCNPSGSSSKAMKSKKKGRKRKSTSAWNSEDDEPEQPEYPPGILKPDITFFGEKLSADFEKALAEDRNLVDLIIVIGTSLKVTPVSEMLTHLPHSIPQIVINKTPIKHVNSDIVLLGDADEVVQHLCYKLGWDIPEPPSKNLQGSNSGPLKRTSSDRDVEPRRVGKSHVWLYEGAEGGKWVQDIERQYQPPSASSDMQDISRPKPKKPRTIK